MTGCRMFLGDAAWSEEARPTGRIRVRARVRVRVRVTVRVRLSDEARPTGRSPPPDGELPVAPVSSGAACNAVRGGSCHDRCQFHPGGDGVSFKDQAFYTGGVHQILRCQPPCGLREG